MPFIVDDILIRFDDDRARATLDVLAELSKKTRSSFSAPQTLADMAQKLIPSAEFLVMSRVGC